ncbi:SRPBCC family protein [Micromonospora sp. FIMYZ51]|uniref:SRPBCC family protein n=1 Tax=Micromonospora sp. FIMYZ51 TaxID=3051832 RepID=UPI00311E1ADD
MKIINEFAVNIPVERAWTVLTDLEGIAPCLPGAQLTGVDGDVHKGKVKVKVGPVVSEFAGTARFVEKDDVRRRAVIDAKGRDARSAANAAAVITAELRPEGDRTLVSVDTDLKISGKLAQFGSGMIKEVSGKLLAQFVANLEAKLATEGAPVEPLPTAAAPVEPVATSATATASGTSAASAIAGTSASAGSSGTSASAAGEKSPGGPSAAAVAGRPEAPAAAPAGRTAARPEPAAEPEALDLLDVAGGSVAKRLVPVLVGVVAVGAVIAWLVARR